MKRTIALLLCALIAFSLCACENMTQASVDGQSQYTLRFDLEALPTEWSPLQTDEAHADVFAQYISAGLYSYTLNGGADGYALSPYAAAELPEDVTAQYAGSFGIEQGEQCRAYKITLRPDLKWQDGTAITAQDYVDSTRYLEEPTAQNSRADIFFGDELTVYNAENYFRQGQTVLLENSDGRMEGTAALTASGDGSYCMPDGAAAYLAVAMPLKCMGGFSLKEYVDNYGQEYFDLTNWPELLSLADENGLVPLTDSSLALLASVTTAKSAWGETQGDMLNYLVYPYTYPEADWADVGIFAVSETEFVLILENPLSAAALARALTESWLINIPMYESCLSDAKQSGSFCTGTQTTMSFGPYMLNGFRAGKSCSFVKNPYFFGSGDADMQELFEATAIEINAVSSAEDRLGRYLDGKTDIYSLCTADMAQYASDGQCVYIPAGSTCFAALCPDYQLLEQAQAAAGNNINKTILSIPEFRAALSMALDKSSFFTSDITAEPANSIFPSAAVGDELGGVMYAPDSALPGYDPARVKELINIAYDKAIQAGYIDGDDVVELSAAVFEPDILSFLSDSWSAAAQDTKLTGRLMVTACADGVSAEVSSLGRGAEVMVDIGWEFDETDPYASLNALVSPNGAYGAIIDYTQLFMSFPVNDALYTASIWRWSCALAGETIELTGEDASTLSFSCAADAQLRQVLLRAVEKAILEDGSLIALMYPADALLIGQKLTLPNSDYVYGVGFGGVRALKFNYSDAEWSKTKLTNGIE